MVLSFQYLGDFDFMKHIVVPYQIRFDGSCY
jgi:hypothetical protein